MDMKYIEKLFDNKVAKTSVLAVLVLLALFLFVQTLQGFMQLRYVGSGIPPTNTISVEGTGEVFAVPDIARISFSVQFEAETVAAAQEQAATVSNEAVNYVQQQGVAEADIQTTGYNVYPQYTYVETACAPGVPCPRGERQLRGYEVEQRVSVKVRDTEQVGALLAGLGNIGVQNISGPNFTIDDPDAVQKEAREEAIAEAQEKARELAKELNVRLVRVVGFWENNDFYQPQYAESRSLGMGGDMVVPSIPPGENEIRSRVNITYEIR